MKKKTRRKTVPRKRRSVKGLTKIRLTDKLPSPPSPSLFEVLAPIFGQALVAAFTPKGLTAITAPLPNAQTIGAEFEQRLLSSQLERFKTTEAQLIAPRIPDYTTVLTGWRAWRLVTVQNQWRLASLGQRTRWAPLVPHAAKCRSHNASPHPAPHFECLCGVWAFKDLDRLVAALEGYDDLRVLGTVSLWGRVIETENGYRAEYAYPAELWLLEDHLEDVARIYGVPARTRESVYRICETALVPYVPLVDE